MENIQKKGAVKPEGTPPRIPHKVTINETAQIATVESRHNFRLPAIRTVSKRLPKPHSSDTSSSKLSSKLSLEESKASSKIWPESATKVSTDFIVNPMIVKKKLSDSPAKIVDKGANKIPRGKKPKSDSIPKEAKAPKPDLTIAKEPKESKGQCGNIDCESSCSCSIDCGDCDHERGSSSISIEENKVPIDASQRKRSSDTKGEKVMTTSGESPSPKRSLRKSQSYDESNQDLDLTNPPVPNKNRSIDVVEPRGSNAGQENIVYSEVYKIEETPPLPCSCGFVNYDNEDPEAVSECLCNAPTEDSYAIEFLRMKIHQMEMEMNYQQQNITKHSAQLIQLQHGMTVMETFQDEMSINLSFLLNCACATQYQMRKYINRVSMQKLFRIIDKTLFKYITEGIRLETNPASTKEYLKLKIMLHIAGNLIISKEARSFLPTEPMLDFMRNLTFALSAFQSRPFGEEMEGTILKIMYNFSLEKPAIVVLQRQEPVLISVGKYISFDKQPDKKFFGLQFAHLLTRSIPEKYIQNMIIDNFPMRHIEAYAEHSECDEVKFVANEIIRHLRTSNKEFKKYGRNEIPAYYRMDLEQCHLFHQEENMCPVGRFEDRMCAKYEDIDRSRKLKGSIVSYNEKLEALAKEINLIDNVNTGSLDQIADSLSKFQFTMPPVYTEPYPYHYTVHKMDARVQKSSMKSSEIPNAMADMNAQPTTYPDHEVTDHSDDYKSATSKPHTSG